MGRIGLLCHGSNLHRFGIGSNGLEKCQVQGRQHIDFDPSQFDPIRPQSIRPKLFDQKGRPNSFRPISFDPFHAIPSNMSPFPLVPRGPLGPLIFPPC